MNISKVAKWILATLLLVVAVALSFFITVQLFLGKVESLAMPDLQGKELLVALEELNQIGLSARVAQMEFSGRFEKGMVIGQRPPAGRQIKKGRSVNLTVSKGLDRMAMPELVGLQRRLAEQILRNNSLALAPVVTACSHQDNDVVLSQFPRPFETAPRSMPVELLVSSGSCNRYFIMPQTRRAPFQPVAEALAIHDIGAWQVNSEVRHQGRQRLRPGEIVEQQPAVGTVIRAGDVLRFDVVGAANSPVSRLKLQYLNVRVPYGFGQHSLRISYLLDEQDGPSVIDKQVEPGQNVELIVGSLLGKPVELLLDDRLVSRFSLEGE